MAHVYEQRVTVATLTDDHGETFVGVLDGVLTELQRKVVATSFNAYYQGQGPDRYENCPMPMITFRECEMAINQEPLEYLLASSDVGMGGVIKAKL